jgi:hypothetical protein
VPKNERFERIKKDNRPGPGHYKNLEAAIDKTQHFGGAPHKISKTNWKNFIEETTTRKAVIPGVGYYKNSDYGYTKLSSPPSALARRRS